MTNLELFSKIEVIKIPCYYPLKGWITGIDSATGKKIVKVTSAVDKGYPGLESFPVPCGRCIGCRLDYSKQWANRCMMEAQYHEHSCFITLTYDDLHVPRSYGRSSLGGSCISYSLHKEDLQKFFKRLRKHFEGVKIRYFGCGEYGSRTFRPHYHVILFGIDFEDKVPTQKSQTGNVMFTSQTLNRIWSFPPRILQGESHSPNISNAGICTVQPVTYETCAYTARYVTKKLKGPMASFYEEKGIEPPFCLMSRRPGIGARYYEDHPEIWDSDFIHIATQDGGVKFRPPRYFEKLLERDDPYSAEAMKEVKKAFALQANETIEELSGMEHDQYLNRQADILSAKVTALQRSGV